MKAARALALFDEALALPDTARVTFLDAACGDDAELRHEVETLLAADAEAGGFLAAPLIAAPRDRAGEMIGPWRLLHELGQGGMGTVYLAERADGLYDQRVALKLLRFDAGDLRARFEAERRILAGLEHPNIARLRDAGSDANGVPWVALDYVEGEPITRWCAERRLEVRARVALFRKVLDAVQHAHGRLIVHRDLKPANILVDGQGEPKLLDFGIAKLVDAPEQGLTRTGFTPMTPDYASPEQVYGEPIGTASDVYSLGVLLYELLASERPYAIRSNAPGDIARAVIEVHPGRPSEAAASVRGIDRDLDHVVLKAMAKDVNDRYASCAQFGDDLQRWLDGVPVQAHHAGWPYRLRKFVVRHRLGVVVAVLVALAVLGSAAVALVQARDARAQARLARAERDKAERVNGFLQSMLAAADPADLGRKVTVLDVLARAEQQAERELAGDAAIRAATELTLTRTYAALGDYEAARRVGARALATAQAAGQSGALIEARLALGAATLAAGDAAAAAEVLAAARADAVARGTALQRGQSANQLGLLEQARGDRAKAATWFATALTELPAGAVDARAEALNDYALVKGEQSDAVGALALQREAVALLREAYPKGHPLLAQALSNLAVALDDNGQRVDAGRVYAEALAMKIDRLGESHPGVVMTLGSMTWHDLGSKDTAAALAHGAQGWSLAQKLPSEHPAVGYIANLYAQALLAAERAAEAVPLLETSLRVRKVRYPAGHMLVVNTESVLGLAKAKSGDRASGEALARSAWERQRAQLGEAHEMTVFAKRRLDEIRALPDAEPAAKRE